MSTLISQNKLNDEDGFENELRLDEKVFNYIKLHSEGTNIQNLEYVFGESKVRLGYIINKLLNDSKIIKVQGIYFPYQSQENQG